MASSNSPPKKKLKQESCRVSETVIKCTSDSDIQEYKIQESSNNLYKESKSKSIEKSCIEDEILVLREEYVKLKEKLKILSSECSEIEMEDFLGRLHDYNDIKDATQILLGKLADFDEKPVSALYSRFGLNTTD